MFSNEYNGMRKRTRTSINDVNHFLKELYERKGQVSFKDLPNNIYHVLLKQYGSIRNACKSNNIPYNGARHYSKEELVAELKRLANDHPLISTKVIEDNSDIAISNFTRAGGIINLCKENNIPYNTNRHYNVTKEELSKEIYRLVDQFGYVSKPIMAKYSSYNTKIVNRLYGSFTNMYEEMGLTRHPSGYVPTTEELLDDLRRLLKEYKAVSKEVVSKYGKYSTTCYQERFKGLNNARKILGLNPVYPGEAKSQTALATIQKIANVIDEEPILEKTFEWLKNPETNAKLRVDAYFPKHNLAIEYNGPQHYHEVEMFNGTLSDQQKRDAIKIRLVKEHGIKIHSIHYLDNVDDEYIHNILK